MNELTLPTNRESNVVLQRGAVMLPIAIVLELAKLGRFYLFHCAERYPWRPSVLAIIHPQLAGDGSSGRNDTRLFHPPAKRGARSGALWPV